MRRSPQVTSTQLVLPPTVAVSGALAAGERVVARGSEDLVAGAAAP